MCWVEFGIIKKKMKFSLQTKGQHDIINITDRVQEEVKKSGVKDGIVLVAVAHSTCGITTIEYEPGLLKDLPEIFEKIAPSNKHYHHNDTWGDANGHSHILSAIVGTSRVFPIEGGEVVLGAWQQLVLIEFDPRMRTRNVIAKIIESK